MVTVAIGAIFLLAGVGEERFVLLGIDIVLRVTTHARWIYLWPRIHNIGRRTVLAPRPGFVGNVGITITVAVRAANIRPCMDNGNILCHVAHMANEAATVIGYEPGRRDKFLHAIIKQQQGLIIRYGFGAGLGFCICIRLLFSLHSLTACSENGDCRQNKAQVTVFHTFCPGPPSGMAGGINFNGEAGPPSGMAGRHCCSLSSRLLNCLVID